MLNLLKKKPAVVKIETKNNDPMGAHTSSAACPQCKDTHTGGCNSSKEEAESGFEFKGALNDG